MTKENKKQSLLAGALTGSFGVFISKALGLFYVVPLNSLAGESNMAFYSITYTYYDMILKICQAGIPFAIAALVAKYVGREDYKTALLVRKLGTSFIMGMSFLIAFFFFLGARPLAVSSLGAEAAPEDIASLTNLFYILLLAVITVPYLSSVRGFYQGLKRLDIYAVSQVLEQLVRVTGIVGLGFLFVKLLHFQNIYAIYMAVLAASLAAVVTILYFLASTRRDSRYVRQQAAAQEGSAQPPKKIMREILSLGIPYVIISFLGTMGPLVNAKFFLSYATSTGIDYEIAKQVLGIVQTNCSKIASIPQVLSLGFSAGLVPYLSDTYEKQDIKQLRRQLRDIFGTVLYILIPVVLIIAVFSAEIYAIMYGSRNVVLGGSLLRRYALVAFTDTVAPIFSSILITLRFRLNAIAFLVLSAVLKTVTFFVLIKAVGYSGMIYSTALASILVIVLGTALLKKQFSFDIRSIASIAVRTLLSSLVCVLPIILFSHFVPHSYDSRFLLLIRFGVEGIVMVVIYLAFSTLLRLPQQVFRMKEFSLKELLKRFRA